MAQVARDRPRPALPLGQHEVVPAERRLEAGGELADARARRLPCAKVEVRGGSARRRVEAAASRAASAPSAIWPTESRNFAATSPTASVPARAAPASRARRVQAAAPLTTSTVRCLPAQPRSRDAATDTMQATATGREGRLAPDALARIEPDRARRSRARRRRARPRARRPSSASALHHTGRRPAARGDALARRPAEADASGPATTTGRRLSIAQQGRGALPRSPPARGRRRECRAGAGGHPRDGSSSADPSR